MTTPTLMKFFPLPRRTSRGVSYSPTNAVRGVFSRVVLSTGVTLSVCQFHAAASLDQPSEPQQTEPQQTDSSDSVSSPTDLVVQECEITFRTGRRLTGILMESNDDTIVIKLNGIDTTFQRSKIAKIRFLPPIHERYAKLKEAIPAEDIDARLALVDWLRDRKAYGLALGELNSILETDPSNPSALLLKRWLESHLELQSKRREKADSTDATKRRASRERKRLRAPDPNFPTLTDEQINLMRVYAIDLADPPKLHVPDSTVQKLIHQRPELFPTDTDEHEKILRGTDLEKLKLLFRNKARELYTEVQVREDPQMFKDFRSYIAGQHGWVINFCATSGCHGGPDAGDFQLRTHRAFSTESLYTNFYIIDQYTLKDGTKLVNHTDPERSPLIQMGFSEVKSLHPHPPITDPIMSKRMRPVFQNSNTLKYKRSVEWVRSLRTPRPNYGFEYPPKEHNTENTQSP